MKLISWKSLVLIVMLAFLLALSYRLSEQFGEESQAACAKAIKLTVLAGIFGILPVLIFRNSKRHIVFAGILSGALLRLMVTIAGIIIIRIQAHELNAWFLGWAAGFYMLFLVLETAIGVKVLNKITDKEPIRNDNEFILGKYESS